MQAQISKDLKCQAQGLGSQGRELIVFWGLFEVSGKLLVPRGQDGWAQPDSRGSHSYTLPTQSTACFTSHSDAHCGSGSTHHR